MNDKDREAFEDRIRNTFPASIFDFRRGANGEYTDSRMVDMYGLWQAAHAHRDAEIDRLKAELEKAEKNAASYSRKHTRASKELFSVNKKIASDGDLVESFWKEMATLLAVDMDQTCFDEEGESGKRRLLWEAISAINAELKELREAVMPEDGVLLQRRKGGSGCVGNAVLWWAKDGGYTTDPYKARVWTFDAGTAYADYSRGDYIAYPVSFIRDKVSHCVDMQSRDRGALEDCLSALAKQGGE